MNRRDFITLLGGAAVMPSMLWPRRLGAQQPPKLLRIGMVSMIKRSNFTWVAFEQRMRELG
jgi:hypothetical protein